MKGLRPTPVQHRLTRQLNEYVDQHGDQYVVVPGQQLDWDVQRALQRAGLASATLTAADQPDDWLACYPQQLDMLAVGRLSHDGDPRDLQQAVQLLLEYLGTVHQRTGYLIEVASLDGICVARSIERIELVPGLFRATQRSAAVGELLDVVRSVLAGELAVSGHALAYRQLLQQTLAEVMAQMSTQSTRGSYA